MDWNRSELIWITVNGDEEEGFGLVVDDKWTSTWDAWEDGKGFRSYRYDHRC